MKKLIIKGKILSGNISKISGSKNATLPILAASILSDEELKNIPLVNDILTMVQLLKFIGLKCTKYQKINIINYNKKII